MNRKFSVLPAILAGTLLASSLVAPAAGATGSSSGAQATVDPMLPVHPLLQVGAQLEPDKKVKVIVQKQRSTDSGRPIAASVGAQVKEEFGIVKSLVLEVPQRAVLALAHNPSVGYISPDSAVRRTIDASQLKTTYPLDVKAPAVWNSSTTSTQANGYGVTVAVIDTGFNPNLADFDNTSLVCLDASLNQTCAADADGHGTAVIGIIAGHDPYGRYVGVAPSARIISLQALGPNGSGAESDVVRALQWVFDNRATYNIKVVNLSLAGSVAQSYRTAPISGALEQLWLNGVTVVAAAGNSGSATDATWYAPGNDPFVISVGALDDGATTNSAYWSLASFSSRGTTQDGYYKPEIVAPGRHVVTTLAGPSSLLAQAHPSWIVDTNYIRLGGTSLAAPVVSGVAALVLQRYPNLTPNQLKWLLTHSTDAYPGQADGAGEVDALKALQTAANGMIGQANQGLAVNSNVSPTSNSVVGGQTYWNQTYWNQTYWNQTYWNQTYWN